MANMRVAKRKGVRGTETAGPIIGHNLKLILEENGIRGTDMADALELDDRTVYRWIKGEVVPGWPALLRLSKTYGKTPDWFYVDRRV